MHNKITLLTNKAHIKGRQHWGMLQERWVTIFTSPARPPTCNHQLECSIFIVKVHILGNSLCEKVF